MANDHRLPESFFAKVPLANTLEAAWPTSMMIFHRNLASFPFPAKMDESQREQTLQLIQNVLLPHLDHPQIMTIETLTQHDKELIVEHFFLNEGFEKFERGHAFIIDASATFLGLINVEDHMHLYFTDPKGSLQELWNKASAIERTLSKQLDFAFSNRFGYLTSNPSVCGTGLIVRSFLHLPFLIQTKKLPEVLESCDERILVQGLGKESEYIADLVLLENRYKIGVTEQEIVSEVEKASKNLIVKELECKQSLSPESLTDLKDKIGRAYGLLTCAKKLQIYEALSALSLLQVAESLKWTEQDQPLSFYNFFFHTRRAHLLEELALPDLTPEALLEKRAEIIQTSLKKTTLNLPT